MAFKETAIVARALTGAVLSVVVVLAARRTRTLSSSGALAGAMVGTICMAAGWNWGALLLSLFISSSALSRVGQARKASLVDSVVEKGSERDAGQVLANGGVFAVAALGQLASPSPLWLALGAGAIAASTADTWATEIGTLSRAGPVSILSLKRVPAGTSGGVTALGNVAAAAGAAFIAAEATLASWPVPFAAVAVGGMAGALADSVLGATVQARRWCEACSASTERLVHTCGARTTHAAGLEGFDNDVVNAVCSAVGALVALGMSRMA
ncbi:MAG TPA: DUF92 domain-containing protein [Gemmatimonadaceae bacterium]|nr:DUF92 domain-containing protein [Gemmatimonadaceae bacterium]